jgi:predicted nucleic acid-binding protein
VKVVINTSPLIALERILLAASKRGLVEDVESAVDALTTAGFRVSQGILDKIRRLAS